METSSEEEIASQIIDLHDRVHLGFRKIAHRLLEEGSGKISKGTAWRLYKKHETPGPLQIQEDEELGKLKGKAERARRSFELFKQKNELRRNIAAFVVQRLMEDFGGRRRIFTEEKCLFRFAKRILRVTHPDLWTEFSEYCEMHGIEVASTLLAAVGSQQPFEDQLVSSERLSLELYLVVRMRLYLKAWKNQAENEDGSSEQESTEDNETDEYTDDQGFTYITIPNPYDSY